MHIGRFVLSISLAAGSLLAQSAPKAPPAPVKPAKKLAPPVINATKPSANPLSDSLRKVFANGKTNVIKAAEKMPEEDYDFKPANTVRSFGQIVGHIADAQYLFCAPVLGRTKADPSIEVTKTSKADLVKAVKDAFAYCDMAYTAMTDANAPELVSFLGPKMSVLNFNTTHMYEHYGNLVTYMRIKGLVPPSSETPEDPTVKKKP